MDNMISLCYCTSDYISSLENRTALFKPKLNFLSIQLWWESLKNPLGEPAPFSCRACQWCLLQHEMQYLPVRVGNPRTVRTELRIRHIFNSKYNLSALSKYTEVDSKRHVVIKHHLPRTQAYSWEKLNNGVYSLRKSG